MALTDKVDDWMIFADSVLGAAVGVAAARYDFFLHSPPATPGHAARIRLSIFGVGFGGHASSVPLSDVPAAWVDLESLRPFSVWDLNQGPGSAAAGGVGVGVGFGAVLIDGFSNGGRSLFRNILIAGFSGSAGASIIVGAGRWRFLRTTVPLTSPTEA